MYTSILAFALAGFFPPANSIATPTWLTDYSAAKSLGAKESKPLAVFLGSGSEGWNKLSREGSLSAIAKSVLAEKYICVHIDTGTQKGKSLADAFEIRGGLGIIVSDRTGQVQAFRHEGDLVDSNLIQYLQKYGDPTYVARATESNPGERVSNYSPGYSLAPASYSNCPT